MMEGTRGIHTPTKKIYKENAIWVGTFLGGPLAAGYLIAENFKVFNDYDKSKKTWVYTIIATIVVFGGVFLIPDNIEIPNQIIPLIYTAIAYFLVRHFQGKDIAEHVNSGGQSHSWWTTIAVGIIGLAITMGPIVGFALLSDNIEDASVLTKTYGIMKHEIAYHEGNISEGEVDKIAAGLTKTTFFDEAVTKYVFVNKVNNRYELSISVVDGIANDHQLLAPFRDLRTDLQTFFPNNKIVFKLVVNNLDNVVKTIE